MSELASACAAQIKWFWQIEANYREKALGFECNFESLDREMFAEVVSSFCFFNVCTQKKMMVIDNRNWEIHQILMQYYICLTHNLSSFPDDYYHIFL